MIGDDELGYRDRLTVFAPGAGLRMDESYRLAHLPLLAPDHPDAILRQPGKPYESGRHAAAYSLVLPVDAAALAASEGFQALEQALRDAPFAHKIAWDLLPRRTERLHATICGSLQVSDDDALLAACREALSGQPPFRVVLRGLFSGTINLGRLYLRVYPQRSAGADPLGRIQAAFGRAPGRLSLVGLYNLVDHLDAREARALADLLARFWDRDLLELSVERLWLLRSYDDLVLDSQILAELPLRLTQPARPAQAGAF